MYSVLFLLFILQIQCEAQSVLTPDISWFRTTKDGVQQIPRYNGTLTFTVNDSYVTDSGTLVFWVRSKYMIKRLNSNFSA